VHLNPTAPGRRRRAALAAPMIALLCSLWLFSGQARAAVPAPTDPCATLFSSLEPVAVAAKAKCKRSCSAAYLLTPRTDHEVFQTRAFIQFSASGKCGCNVLKRCKERAKKRAHTCMDRAWFNRLSAGIQPDCQGLPGYSVPGGKPLQQAIIDAVRTALGNPSTGNLKIDVHAWTGGQHKECKRTSYLGTIDAS